MTARIEIKGLEKLAKKIKTLEQMEAVKQVLKDSAREMAGHMKVYPPSSEANVPRTVAGTGTVLPWYERGWGTRYIGGGGRNTSEKLDKSWAGAKPQIRKKGLEVAIGTNVSYAPFVQAHDEQATFHKKRGWKTEKQILEREQDGIVDQLKDDIQKIIDS